MTTTGELYMQTSGSEAKHFPFFGEPGEFRGEYGSLTLPQKIRGLLRIMEAAGEVEANIQSQMEQVAQRHYVEYVQNSSNEGEDRLFRSVVNVHKTTQERLRSNREALEALRALVNNTYGLEGEEAKGEEVALEDSRHREDNRDSGGESEHVEPDRGGGSKETGLEGEGGDS